MSRAREIVARAGSAVSELNPRERLLLGVLAALISGLVLFLLLSNYNKKTGALETAISEKRDTIDLIMTRRDQVVAARAQNDALDEALESNNLRIAAFIESIANRLRVTRPRDFNNMDQTVVGHDDITATATVTTFPDMTPEQLGQVLHEIESSEELVYVQRVKVSPQRRGSNFEVEVTLVTYRREAG